MKFRNRIIGALALLPLVGLLGLTGNHGAMAASLEEKLAATGTVEDHLAAARYYQNEARELDAEAAKFETAVSKIGRYEDTKGFRRAALTAAAQEKRVDAKEMQERYATHFKQSQALYGKALPK
jgi:hypothetical protein